MKKYLITLAGSLVLATTGAMAASPQYHDSHGHDSHDSHYQNDHRRHDEHIRHDDYRAMHERGRREGWYRKGGHVPVEYRSSRYVVTDWRARRLRPPPRGYHWVRSDDNQYLLVAITTGVIASILTLH